MERHDTDILILGSGGAGMFAALHAQQTAPEGTKITIAVKGLLGKCGCTRMVQGGYNVALGGGDTVERHFMDTIEGGKWLPDQDMAWRLCETAVERIRELENEIGCFFDRTPDGALHQKAFAGQTADRTVHKGDLTGIEIISRLMEQVLKRPIEKLQEHRAVGLIPTPDGKGRRAAKRQLAERFEQAIDRCAMKVGAKDDDAYLAEWRKVGPVEVDGADDAAVADAEAARLECEFDLDRIKVLIANDGWAEAR